jgi:hypothetical protein
VIGATSSFTTSKSCLFVFNAPARRPATLQGRHTGLAANTAIVRIGFDQLPRSYSGHNGVCSLPKLPKRVQIFSIASM